VRDGYILHFAESTFPDPPGGSQVKDRCTNSIGTFSELHNTAIAP